MKLLITRSSCWDDTGPKVKGAKRDLYTYVDFRTAKSLAEGKKHFWYEDWYNSGTNHRAERGMIACDRYERVPRWTIEADSLEDILKLVTRYGKIIISHQYEIKEVEWKVEIYDSYQE